MTSRPIAVAILNWNGADLLARFLPSVVEHSSADAQIYVVDNGSNDHSQQLVDQQFPEVVWLPLDSNYGFTGGYNRALAMLQEPIVCLLNNDVQVGPGWLAGAADYFSNNPKLAAAQPVVLDLNHPQQYEYAGAAGGLLDNLGYPYCYGRRFLKLDAHHGQYGHVRHIDWATGAAMLVRRDLYLGLGGLDQDYFAHQEEIDLCWRFRNMGYAIHLLPQSHVFHLGGGTLQHTNPRKTFLNFRNSLLNIVKNDYHALWVGKVFIRMVLDGLAAAKFLAEGKPQHLWAILRAHFSFYARLPRYLRHRKNLKKSSLDANTTPRIGTTSIVWEYYLKGLKSTPAPRGTKKNPQP